MDDARIVLAALQPAEGAPYSPVQVQKLLFLLDREISQLTGGPHFDFVPYNYGPFDKRVYRVLDELDDRGLVTIRSDGPQRTYALTPKGQTTADEIFHALPEPAQEYIRRASDFVRRLTFTQLVSAIYKSYPDMQANSVFVA